MNDYITYCADTTALIAELQTVAPTLVSTNPDTGEVSFNVPKTPTVRNGNETLALVRDMDGSLLALSAQLTTLTVLGTYDEVFADPAKRDIYDRVYDQTPISFTDEDGTQHTFTPPEKFGVFA